MTNFLVTAINGNELTIVPPLDIAYPVGTPVGVAAANAQLAAPAVPGDTSVVLTDVSYIVPGMTIAITDTSGNTEYRTVTSVDPNTNTVTFGVPLGGTYGTGAGAAQGDAFLVGMMIFDKAGQALGTIRDYTINDARSFSIGEPGSMTFYMPRNSPEISLIKSDRLIAVGNEVGMPIWVGTITTQEWTGSTGNIHCEDAFSLLTGVAIDMTEEVVDEEPAWTMYQRVIDKVNTRRGLDGEIQWFVDTTGSTKLFKGDFEFSGNPDDALRTIADRSGTEYAWRGTLFGSQLELTLQVRDSFAPGAGVAFTDGPGGNVTASPTYQVDPTTIINGLRLKGDQTDIKRYVDDWAEWAIHDIEPEVEVYADPGEFRRRTDLDINVDFSLSKREQRALAQKTADEVWGLFERYLYAIHDIQGRVNHQGWVYEGAPEDIEPLLTMDKWHTHLELAKFRDTRPCSIVMASDDSYLIVTYNVTFDRKDVHIFGKNDTYTPKEANLQVSAGSHIIYDESGSRAIYYTTYTNSSTETWLVTLGTITAKLPDGTRITLRGIKAPTAVRGRYINVADPGYYGFDPVDPITDVDPTGSLVGRIWGIEKPTIRQWDPRRDGIGAKLVRTTVYNAQTTTRPRWHIVPYSTGEQAETQLAAGVYIVDVTSSSGTNYADQIFVESGEGFPLDDTPFDIVVGDPLEGNQEVMRVGQTFGNQWNVRRGQSVTSVQTVTDVSAGALEIPVTDGAPFVTSMTIIIGTESGTIQDINGDVLTMTTPLTSAHASGTFVTTSGLVNTHAAGSPVHLLNGKQFDGFEYPYTWPEGEEYANNLLARLSLPSRSLTLNITNENDDWSTVAFGSTHSINIQSEGPPGGVTGTVRILGFSPDEDSGTMEVHVEILP